MPKMPPKPAADNSTPYLDKYMKKKKQKPKGVPC